MDLDLQGLVIFMVMHTAGETDMRNKAKALQKSYDKVKAKEKEAIRV